MRGTEIFQLLVAAGALAANTSAFSVVSPSFASKIARNHDRINSLAKSTKLYSSEGDNGINSERFQALLRDLQIENVPILGCDADQVTTLMAATWTTMADISERDGKEKVCLVMEKIPIGALSAFVDDFSVLKLQPRLMAHLPELSRISVSLIGKDAGPAFVIEAAARTETELAEKAKRVAGENVSQEKAEEAVRAFVQRSVIGENTCPYTKNVDMAPVALEAKGVQSGPIGYRYGASSDACAALATFWNNICEILGSTEDVLSSTMLSLPAIGPGTSEESHDRFAAVVEIIGRYLCLYRGDSLFGLVHFHPAYDRSRIFPLDKPAYGQLPPRSWLRPIIKLSGNDADSLTDEDLALSDYQRRAPHTTINILRVNQLNAAAGPKSIVDLELEDGTTEKASGIVTYSRNAIHLASIGKDALEQALQEEIAILSA